jgi:hypothetical protein
LHFALALMHEFPHGWPFEQRLQQVGTCCASSSHLAIADGAPWSGHGV